MRAGAVAGARGLTALALRQVLGRLMLARYLLASIVALCADTALFLALSHRLLPPAPAACAGYVFGIAVHWLLSVRFVFTGGVAARASAAQPLQFLLSALLGLGVTTGVVALATGAGAPALPAKLAAVAISFTLVYLVRKHVVFARV
jgi:putative flippase GtrA